MSLLKRFANDLIALVYPRLCLICSAQLQSHKVHICLKCEAELPLTRFEFDNENPFAMRLHGRLDFVAASALYTFHQSSGARQLMHRLKYDNKPWVGVTLGRMLGEQLKASEGFKSVDVILPVPLHPRKERERGYNQSKSIAEGIAAETDLPILNGVLTRKVYSESQTKMSKDERIANVREMYALAETASIKNKHVLLVDDVMTTGATLEACGKLLTKVEACSVSFATVCIVE